MNINIVLYVENEIIKAGFTSIIHDGILASKITAADRSMALDRTVWDSFDIAIIEIRGAHDSRLELIQQLAGRTRPIKIFAFAYHQPDAATAAFLKAHEVEMILENQSPQEILKLLTFHLRYRKVGKRFRRNKNCKLKSLGTLLSDREIEIGMMLVRGETIATISQKKNLAASTVSTYKKRIFEKTNVKNVIEMSRLFVKARPQLTRAMVGG
ncbi:MAG: hypothetical protein CFE23_09610 [Flavobacterium sp. BFFFF1]|uniref:helix-turn-helix transcriptional regulator n=1 Tax=unclassified Flavobacterium TaxID=196869 RepID=UPI000BC470EB|nr:MULTISPECIES: LuxR C-terminal-related transcriptional regulator [unclassified Flavobacterium]OYU80314.1 MAG: hypothetical protein CFE23_09610 [Flavobacterium sp. BFFFF1]